MTRSIRKTPIAGRTAVSEKDFKRQARRATRANCRTGFASTLAAHGIDDFVFVTPGKPHGDAQDGPKRGKEYLTGVRVLRGPGRRLVAVPADVSSINAVKRMRK